MLSPVRYRDYLAWEGGLAILLGLELALVAFPGLSLSYRGGWAGPLFVPATLAIFALVARRRGIPLLAAGRWFTERPLAEARSGRPGLAAEGLRGRLVIETAIWIIAVTLWVLLVGSSGLLIFGTGLASAAYGAVQAFASRGRVLSAEQERGTTFVVAERPSLGTPHLGSSSTEMVDSPLRPEAAS